MCTDSVMRHQLLGHLPRQPGLEAPADVDGCQFTLLRGTIFLEFRPLA